MSSFLLGYPTQAPTSQHVEAGPVKTQSRGEKGFIEGWYVLLISTHNLQLFYE